ncbi:uncharacterized protein [Anoplolepis gracilipes]|uniref:uncharacterized protein n=1 Tax=Anoplolepis gracilipes TaxID=354296 RepID=UPI003BA3052F
MQAQNCDIEKTMKDAEISLLSMESSKPICVEDLNIIKKENIANQTTLHNTQPVRNLPNILRNNNTRIYKNDKALMLDKIDSCFLSKDINTSFELNTILSSIDLEMEASYNKITSSKSHHQRKQVHNPLDLSYDMPDWNNNKDKNLLQKFDHLNTLHIPLSYKKNASLKKLKYNKEKGNLYNKKSRRLTGRKSSCKKKSYKKLDFDTGLATISQVNIKENITVQDVSNFSNNIILTQSVCEPNTSEIKYNNSNYVSDLNDIETKSVELSNIFYYNNEIYNFEKKYNRNCNPIISGNLTEFNTMQNKNVIQENLINYEFPIMVNDFKEELIDRDTASNFSLNPKVLYTCTCTNCMSLDKDIIFYEEPTSINSDMEPELFTYDFYSGDYHGDILGDNWLEELDKKNLCHENFEEMHIIKKNVCTNNDSKTEAIAENNVNVSSMEQNKSQNLQSYRIDKVQDICVESYSTELVTQPNGSINFFESSENINIFDEIEYLNLENSLMKEGKVISQDKSLIQTGISADVPVSKSKEIRQESKEDLYHVIQCAQCGRIFNKKHQFKKHFTRCDFYKEDFKCPTCNKMYRHKSSLAQHLRDVHHVSDGPHEKCYTCTKCSKSYVRFRAFQRHILLHD